MYGILKILYYLNWMSKALKFNYGEIERFGFAEVRIL